jgi:hypothetical protein
VIAKRFKIKKPAGQGAHGMVYLGKDITNELPIACKFVSISMAISFFI